MIEWVSRQEPMLPLLIAQYILPQYFVNPSGNRRQSNCYRTCLDEWPKLTLADQPIATLDKVWADRVLYMVDDGSVQEL